MSQKLSNKRSLFDYSGRAAFKKRIAPKIAEHIQQPINVSVAGEDPCLNAWLIENLSTIAALHVTLATGSQRPKRYKRAKYE